MWGGKESNLPRHPYRVPAPYSLDEGEVREVPPVGGLVRGRQAESHELPVVGLVWLVDAIVLDAGLVEATGELLELILVRAGQGNGVGPVRELAGR